ncbi:hypothetical protein AC579_1815 [Lecanosticta acicola]|uniref:F-box domain-containing protein n=1 Tax=Lecanosticta acicola TaxID=111012 RepID=A0AAI9ECL3_9PEZI|nr:hypothetical protein AC579_1815 [Lecanosticta acicola]
MDFAEQMRRLQVASPSSSSRERRFSDADLSSSQRPHLLAVCEIHNRGTVASETDTPEQAPPQTELEQHTCTTGECSVVKVFETTELLEIILSFLDTTSVLTLSCTNPKWNAITRQSPTLRLHYFVFPKWNSSPPGFKLLDLKLPRLSIEAGDPLDQGHWINVKMDIAAARSICPDSRSGRRLRSRSIFEGLRGGLGPRADREGWPAPVTPSPESDTTLKHESLFIVQPPVLGMQAFILDPNAAVEHDPDNEGGPSACAKLHCDAGITLGFLAETTLSLLSDRGVMFGPDDRTVLFKAIISFTSRAQAPRKRGTIRSVTRIE